MSLTKLAQPVKTKLTDLSYGKQNKEHGQRNQERNNEEPGI